ILSITCDNMSNNNVMIKDLAILVPEFAGSASHTQCFLHTVNLVAKSLIHDFDVAKKEANKALYGKEVANEIDELRTNDENEEDVIISQDLDNELIDNDEGWVDDVELLPADEHNKLQKKI
ncbi:uncharacterized protein BJ212DRAFT_1290239, partial [Suillus subaureus]